MRNKAANNRTKVVLTVLSVAAVVSSCGKKEETPSQVYKPTPEPTVAITKPVVTPVPPKPLATRWGTLRSKDNKINLRTGPGSVNRAIGYGINGDHVQIIDSSRDSGNYTWYKVKFTKSSAEGWIAGHLIEMDSPTTSLEASSAPSNGNFFNESTEPIKPEAIEKVAEPSSSATMSEAEIDEATDKQAQNLCTALKSEYTTPQVWVDTVVKGFESSLKDSNKYTPKTMTSALLIVGTTGVKAYVNYCPEYKTEIQAAITNTIKCSSGSCRVIESKEN